MRFADPASGINPTRGFYWSGVPCIPDSAPGFLIQALTAHRNTSRSSTQTTVSCVAATVAERGQEYMNPTRVS